MSHASRRQIWVWMAACIFLLGPAAIIARAANWTVIFRSSDPRMWNTSAGDSSLADGFTTSLDSAPEDIRYLKLERMDSGETVIIAIARDQLNVTGNLDNEWMWTGGSRNRGPANNQNRLIGIARKSWPTSDEQDHLVSRTPGKADNGYRGWGFSKAASDDPTQTYSWAGSPISKTVFEISVTNDDLAIDEQPLLLNGKSDVPADNNPKPQEDSSATTRNDSPTVRVRYDHGDTVVGILKEGMKYFTNHGWGLQNIPPELIGLTVTRRIGGKPANVAFDAPAGTTVYLLINSDKGSDGGAELNVQLANSGWTRLPDAEYVARDVKHCPIAIYKQDFTSEHILSIEGAGWAGCLIAAGNIALSSGDHNIDNAPENAPQSSTVPTTYPAENEPTAGPPSQISKLQTSIEALSITQDSTGKKLGLASRFSLTASPGVGKDEDRIPISFASPVGPQMHLVLDPVVQALTGHYHINGVEKIELNFEDKYTAQDGCSVEAAMGALMLSMIEGFDIDSTVATTGIVTPDGKVHKIGDVAAKLHAASEAGCTLVTVPTENFEQVKDLMVYDGPAILTNTQVIGISDLDDAAAACRTDRDANLAQAIDLFGQIQKSIKDSPGYLSRPDALDKLQKVVALAPNHYSAKLLMLVSQRKLPRLSARASEYYALTAASEFLTTPATTQPALLGTDESAGEAMGKLKKLRPLADLTIRPFIDSAIDFLQAQIDMRRGAATAQYVNNKYQALLNQAARLNANNDLIQKMLREGI